MRPAEDLEVFVRGWAEPAGKRRQRSDWTPPPDPGPSDWTLIFDTESTTGPEQRLRVGAFQARRNGVLKKEGLFVDAEALTQEERTFIKGYAEDNNLVYYEREDFTERVFFRYAVFKRALVVGHNLPFDLFRIAIQHEKTRSRRRSMRNGFSLKLSENPKRSRVLVKAVHPGAAFIELTVPTGRSPEQRNRERGGGAPNHHGYFLDTLTLGGALFGSKLSLDSLSELLGTEHRKLEGEHGELINADYLRYLRRDVLVTWECADALIERYQSLALSRPFWNVLSEASIGKAHLELMGVRGWDPSGFPSWLVATVMETVYAGRTECRIRNVPVPGVHLDFASQYPSSFALQGLWDFVIADSIDWSERDVGEVRRELEAIDIDAVLKPEFWKTLKELYLVAPDGDRLPTRARFPRRPTRPGVVEPPRTPNLAVCFRTGGQPQWWTKADVVASILHTGRPPSVLRAIAFRPGPPQQGLKPIDVLGRSDLHIDPMRDDLVSRLVELRAQVKAEAKAARAAGQLERARELDAAQQSMKKSANSIAYGCGIEMNEVELAKPIDVTVHLPHGGTHSPPPVHKDEEPGSYFNPLVATFATSGGRLLLAAAMELVEGKGGTYATCDTDSLFVVAREDGGLVACPGGPHRTGDGDEAVRALSWAEVEEVAGSFAALNPYVGRTGSILELEDENFEGGDQREIWRYAIASKRNALFILDEQGDPQIIATAVQQKRSEHGLGHLLPPYAREPDADEPTWKDEWWLCILRLALGLPAPEPRFFPEPAVGSIAIKNPREEATFRIFNEGRDYPDRVRPWNFLCLAHPTAAERGRRGGVRSIVGRFERDPQKRLEMEWRDRGDPGRVFRISTAGTGEMSDDDAAVMSYGDYFREYRLHPEAKMLDPDGSACHPWTRGLLGFRHVRGTQVVRIGKEVSRLRSPAGAIEEGPSEYAGARTCRGCDQAVTGRRQWCSERCRKRASRA